MQPSEKPVPGSASARADFLDLRGQGVELYPLDGLEPLHGRFCTHSEANVGTDLGQV